MCVLRSLPWCGQFPEITLRQTRCNHFQVRDHGDCSLNACQLLLQGLVHGGLLSQADAMRRMPVHLSTDFLARGPACDNEGLHYIKARRTLSIVQRKPM